MLLPPDRTIVAVKNVVSVPVVFPEALMTLTPSAPVAPEMTIDPADIPTETLPLPANDIDRTSTVELDD